MALLHRATITPTQPEAVVGWVPTQPWAADLAPDADVELVGAYRFDDPAGEVGLEGHLVRWGDVVVHVPLTYRGAPLEGAEAALVCTMEHTALGNRWVYDGAADPVFTAMLAASTTTGVGQAAQLVEVDGRLVSRPPSVRLGGGGWLDATLAVGDLLPAEPDGAWSVVRNDVLTLRIARRPAGGLPPAGVSHLTGTGTGLGAPLVLATATPAS